MSSNIFGDDKKDGEFQQKVDTHSKAILSVTQRQKDLESSIDLLDEKIELLDHNSISNFKKLFADIKNIKSDIRSLSDDIKTLKEFNSKMSKQVRLMTTKDEVTKLEKYIDLWNPMEFVSREEHRQEKEEFVKMLTEIIDDYFHKSENSFRDKKDTKKKTEKKTK